MITSLVLKRKLESLREIEDIVSSMKAFANLNVQTAKSSLPNLRIYQNSIEDSFGDIITLFRHLAKGFFNKDILNFFEEIPQENAITVIVGRKGIEAAQSRKIVFERYISGASNVDAIEITAAELSSYLIEIFEKEHFGKLSLIYAQLEGGSYQIVKKNVLPPDFSKYHKKSIQKEPLLYLKAEEILHALIKEYLHISIYGAFIESVASENQARLNAMVQAGNAIGERETYLTQSLNAERQKEITDELLDIVNAYRSMIKSE